MMEVSAFVVLLLSAFTFPFSLPAGRFLFGISLLVLVVDCVCRRCRPHVPAVAWFGAAFFAAAAVSAFAGVDTSRSLRELDKLLWFLAIPVYATLVTSSTRLSAVVGAYCAGTGILALRLFGKSAEACRLALASGRTNFSFAAFVRCLRRFPYGDDFYWDLMDGRDLTDPQLMMAGIAASVGFILICRRERRGAVMWWLLLLVQVPALVLQFKKGTWLSAAFVVLVFILAKAGATQRFRTQISCLPGKRWLLAGLAAVLVAVCMLPSTRARAVACRDYIMNRARTDRPGTRLSMWFVVAPALVRQYPNGVGWCALNAHMMVREYRYVEHRKTLHSNVAQVLVATGWYGLLAYTAWMLKALVDATGLARAAMRRPAVEEMMAMVLLMMLVGLLLNGLVECNLRKADVVLLFSLVMGSVAAARRRLRLLFSEKSSDRLAGPV